METDNPRTGDCRHTNTAYLTMVALDEEGLPTEVPGLEVAGPDQDRRAQVRRANRLAEREQIVEARETHP